MMSMKGVRTGSFLSSHGRADLFWSKQGGDLDGKRALSEKVQWINLSNGKPNRV